MKRLLVVRLSALGDVAILSPVLRERAEANPDVEFVMAGPPRLQPLFDGVSNIRFLPTQKRQSPWSLFKSLYAQRPDMVADMHFVNRVVIADLFFLLHGIPVRRIRKEKGQRRKMMRAVRKDLTPLTPSWKRYDMVFDRCGLNSGGLSQMSQSYWSVKSECPSNVCYIGIAPTAQHKGKVWPLERMEQLVRKLSLEPGYRILLFGGPDEKALLEEWESRYANTESLACKMSFAEELDAISHLHVMVSMDSANMHFASCRGVPVVSVWGATHPNCGFYGWRQNPSQAVQKQLDCRPCSAFGNKSCKWGDYRCLTSIAVDDVYNQVRTLLKS